MGKYPGMKLLGHMRSVYLTSGEIGKLSSKVATLVCMSGLHAQQQGVRDLIAEPRCESGSETDLRAWPPSHTAPGKQ